MIYLCWSLKWCGKTLVLWCNNWCLLNVSHNNYRLEEKFENTKWGISGGESKNDRQYNNQKKNDRKSIQTMVDETLHKKLNI